MFHPLVVQRSVDKASCQDLVTYLGGCDVLPGLAQVTPAALLTKVGCKPLPPHGSFNVSSTAWAIASLHPGVAASHLAPFILSL